MSSSAVLISWIAFNNDPFERQRDGDYRLVGGECVSGPALTVLFDELSEFRGRVKDFVILYRKADDQRAERERKAVEETQTAIAERAPELAVHLEPWPGEDPTDHQQIFAFLREKVPALRRKFAGRDLVIHVSPGTPSMHTIWVLMAETGFIGEPFRVIKSLRPNERRGRAATVPVQLGIETFYKAYLSARPRELGSQEQAVVWDPAKFRSDCMRRLFAEARRFAPLKIPLLLTGERGTGKTTLATWIRLHSPFRKPSLDGDWPAVACGQYSPETMRSELFGHEKGAFTDATRAKDGQLARADGDTLFLDELGDISRDVQRLLIKALEEKTFLPLGAEKSRKSDFRLLTATNIERDELEQRVDADFLDRISPIRLRLPALREIPEELPWLWDDIYSEAARRAISDSPPDLPCSDRKRLVSELSSHPLPGNMRDLFRVAYRLLAARGDAHEPLCPSDAVDYALGGLGALTTTLGTREATPARALAQAFIEDGSIDAIVDVHGPIATKEFDKELRVFLGKELRRLAAARDVSVGELCDVGERAVRGWVSKSGKKVAGERK